jgi:orotidine-5'-phosphate decarboxylase
VPDRRDHGGRLSGFGERLRRAWDARDSALCVGLDPDPARIPAVLGTGPGAILRFCTEIVDATADLVCAFKPQIAYFSAAGAERELEALCAHIRDRHPGAVLILDAKRGDIGDTAEQYAREAFDRYGADAVTVNPYLGTDSLVPFLSRPGRAAIVLCRTSNAGSGEFQRHGGEPLFLRVARTAATTWSEMGEVGLVVGATYPGELAEVRAAAPSLPILVPGVGAQGGDAASVVRAGTDGSGRGLIVNSSRAVLYAGDGPGFAGAARTAALATRDAIRAAHS